MNNPIITYLDILRQDEETVFEVRIPNSGRTQTVAGWFNDAALAAEAVAEWDGVANIYVTMNPVNPALLARAQNRLKPYTKTTTTDADVISRRWLLVDLDPSRPADISSTEAEKEAAGRKAREILDYLQERGWPQPGVGDSGNGYHLLYPVDLPNDKSSEELVKNCLVALACRFDDDEVTVDTSVGNAARIIALYGTKKVKGDNTESRPHRGSRLLTSEPGRDAT